MKKFKNFALRRPFLFGLSFIVIYSILATLSYPVHFLFPDNEVGQVFGDAAAKILIFAVFSLLLWRFGWLKTSGLTGKGSWKIWLITAFVLVYMGVLELYAFTGSLTLSFPDPPLALANLALDFGTGLVEETLYRAIVLIAMVSAWGHNKNGIVKAVVVSSLLFGMLHLLNLMYRPWQVVLFQAMVVSLHGVFYAAMVLTSKSIWPAIVIHWLTNAVVNIKVIGIENFQETTSMWIVFAIGLIPVVVYSVYLIRKLPFFYTYEEEQAEKPLMQSRKAQAGIKDFSRPT